MSDDLPSPDRLIRDVLREMPWLLRDIARSYTEVHRDAFDVERSENLHLAKTDVSDPTYRSMVAKQGKRSDCRQATRRLRKVAKELRAINAHLAASARTLDHHDEDRQGLDRSLAPLSMMEKHRIHLERERELSS